MCLRFHLFLLVAITFVLFPASASASPWTLPEGDILLSINYDFQFAQKEFLPDGTFQKFPLNGQLLSNALRVEARYGFTDRFELSGEIQFKSVMYSADPVILRLPSDMVDLPTARDSVVNFSASEIGAGDVWLTGRYNLLKSSVLITNETRAKFPTGYKPPAGTVNPDTGEIDDDVTLGDGQTDLEDSLLFGVFIEPIKTFARAQVGLRWRFGGPAPQGIAAAKAGTFITPRFLVYAGASGTLSLGEGDIIGKTVISTVDGLQAEDVVLGDNVIETDLPWDRDWVQIEAGLLFVINDTSEVFVDYTQIVWGNNITATKGVNVGVAMRIPTLGDEDE